jgi:hypothetical protein
LQTFDVGDIFICQFGADTYISVRWLNS